LFTYIYVAVLFHGKKDFNDRSCFHLPATKEQIHYNKFIIKVLNFNYLECDTYPSQAEREREGEEG
jgi:hypothetical protein